MTFILTNFALVCVVLPVPSRSTAASIRCGSGIACLSSNDVLSAQVDFHLDYIKRFAFIKATQEDDLIPYL